MKEDTQQTLQENNQSLLQEYRELMKNFDEKSMIKSTWEMRGDSYVQFSIYDESLVGNTAISLSGSFKD